MKLFLDSIVRSFQQTGDWATVLKSSGSGDVQPGLRIHCCKGLHVVLKGERDPRLGFWATQIELSDLDSLLSCPLEWSERF